MRNVSVQVIEKTNTLLCSVIFFENQAAYEITWRKYCRLGQATINNIIWRMRISCWIPKSTVHSYNM